MTLDDLLPAVEHIRQHPDVLDLRAATYLRTYPSILKLSTGSIAVGPANLHQIVLMAYGWMPRIARLDGSYEVPGIKAIASARNATGKRFAHIDIEAIAKYVRSIVGASKVLHFVNPKVFPIWDSKVERFRLKKEPPYNHMGTTQHYLDYATEVQKIRNDRRFEKFYRSFTAAFHKRLRRLNIKTYALTDVRVIEAAAFELAGSTYEA